MRFRALLSIFLFLNLSVLAQNPALLDYYPDSYYQARGRFLTRAKQILNEYPGSKLLSFKVPSKIDDSLYVDMLYIPAQKPERLIILSSGIHGVEGFTGSAIQLMFLDRFLTRNLLKNVSLLVIHSINPYGYKYLRRVSENNVDLNRNSSLYDSLYKTDNPGYDKIHSFINPTHPVNLCSIENKFFLFRAFNMAFKVGVAHFRQALLGGQYKYPKGLYFGGFDQEPQIDTLARFLTQFTKPYKFIMEIDLHTGYGKRGHLHLFPNPVPEPTRRLVESIYQGYEINWGDTTKKFYTTTGDFIDFVGQIAQGKMYVPMTFEFGTVNSHTTLGGIKALHIMILENQGHFYGYKRERDKFKVRKKFLEMYYPKSKKWRLKVMNAAIEMFSKILPRFQSYPVK